MIKLLKKYTTDGEEMAASFMQVLQSMCNYHFYDEECTNFKEYIRKWITNVDRG